MTDNFFRNVGLVEKLMAPNVSIVRTSQETTNATSHKKMAVIIEITYKKIDASYYYPPCTTAERSLWKRQQTQHEVWYRQIGPAVLLQAVESSMARGITSFQYARCCRSGCGYNMDIQSF
ncbi:Mediator of RNA polymerase II transcription subunit [Trichinella spiralis]|uniref:Mediator of RNA polymerase II transcription subunit n=1 Tax=Trichinella spiralis TaxID=6334 RepID=A0ABR3K3D4_TRISP